MRVIATTLAALTLAAGADATAKPPLATLTAETQVALWRCEDQMQRTRTRASVAPWELPRSHAYRKWVLERWTHRKDACAADRRERARQWNWQAWLPAKWYRVGSCETGYGRDPNWSHGNSSYVSAFGIQRGNFNGAYDDDARRVGMPPWSDDPRKRPTPWQQYLTAKSHHDRFGGFAGWGCRNA